MRIKDHVIANRQRLIDGIDVSYILAYYSFSNEKFYIYYCITKCIVDIATSNALSVYEIESLIQSTAENIIDEWILSLCDDDDDNHPIIGAIMLTGQFHLFEHIYPSDMVALAA